VLSRHGHEPLRFLDLGSGSGAICVTLLCERPAWAGVAVDLANGAVQFTKANADHHHVSDRLDARVGSWFEPSPESFNLILSNPPYIPLVEIGTLGTDVKDHDPHLALDGGRDGLDCYRAIAAGACGHLLTGGEVIVEIGSGQAKGVESIFATHDLGLAEFRKDLGGHVRALAFTRK
jgi:release factor glutamine methyltransferase